MDPLVSVVIPTFNRADLIGETISSALAQSYRSFELIVVDDGSTDRTEDVVRQFEDARLRYIRQENRGVSAARNHGIRQARGGLIAFLDSDDLWAIEKLERQVPLFENDRVGWVYCDFERFGGSDSEESGTQFDLIPPVRGSALRYLFVHRFPMQTSCLVARKQCLQAVGMFNEAYSFAEDTDLYFRLAERFEVDYAAEVLAAYRCGPGKPAVPPVERLVRWLELRSNVLDRNPDLRRELSHGELWSAYYKSLLKLAQWNVGLGNVDSARSALNRVIAFKPWSRKALALWALSFGPDRLRSRIKHPG